MRPTAIGEPIGQDLPAAAPDSMTDAPFAAREAVPREGRLAGPAWRRLRAGARGGVGLPAADNEQARRAAARPSLGMAAVCGLAGLGVAAWVAGRMVLSLRREIAELDAALRRSDLDRDERIAALTIDRDNALAASRSKDRAMRTLGHDLRNPLNAIVTSVEVLRAAEPGSEMAESARIVMLRQVRKLTGMIDDLLASGK